MIGTCGMSEASSSARETPTRRPTDTGPRLSTARARRRRPTQGGRDVGGAREGPSVVVNGGLPRPSGCSGDLSALAGTCAGTCAGRLRKVT